MSTPFIWGSAPRTPYDTTTPDQAISEAIASHEDDPDAHLGAGQALESHRAAEIIDHRAESVVNDKLQRNARRYAAIVDPNSDYDFSTVEAAVAYTNGIGGGDILITIGEHVLNESIALLPTTRLIGLGIDESVLTAASGQNVSISWVMNYGDESVYLGVCNGTVGSKTLQTAGLTGYAIEDVIGTGLRAGSSYDVIGEVVAYNQTTEEITLKDELPANVTNTVCRGVSAIEFRQGSNEARVLTSARDWARSWYPGSEITPNSGTFYANIVKRFDDRRLVMSKTYTAANATVASMCSDEREVEVGVQELTIGQPASRIDIECNSMPWTLSIEKCSVFAGSFGVGGVCSVSVIDSYITLGTSGELYSEQDMSIKDSDISGEQPNTNMVACYGELYAENSDLLNANKTVGNSILGLTNGSVLKNCRLSINSAYENNTTTVQTTDRKLLIADSTFTIGTGGSMALIGRGCIYTGNTFRRATTGAVTIPSGSNNNIFCNNRMTGSVTNSGTSNIVANNAVI